MSAPPEAGERHEPTDDGADAGEASSSAGDFLRELAFAPPVAPALPERDRTGQVLGHFRIAERLGRGGMGVVYAAFDLTLRRKVALKLLRAGAVEGEDRRQRLLREARAAAAVSDPHLVAVFEVGEAEGEVFIAMELIEGSDARAWLAATRRTWREIVEVFAIAGRGLAAAHRAGLVHRDFKPENVLIDGAGRARVADFGLAAGSEHHVTPDGLTKGALTGTETVQSGRVQGTPGYIAPEHLAGREADARGDQFAFCVALFEALEGRRPYDALTLLALAQGKAGPPLRPRRAPWWLRGVLARGLAPRPEDRFPDMDALLRRMERARKWSRGAIVAPWLAAAAIAMGVIGLRWPAPEGTAAATAVSSEVRGLHARLAQARALLSAGKYAEGAALADDLRRAGKGVPEVEADAFAVAALLSWKANRPGALEALMQARWAAERARRDALSAELALALGEAYRELGERARAEEWLGHAEATIARVGAEPRLESMLLDARARLSLEQGRRIAAHELALRSLALREQALGPAHLEVAEPLLLVAATVPFDRLPEGVAQARRALDLRVAALGPAHPDVAAAWERLGEIHADQYARAQALEAHQNALRIRSAALGDGHREVAHARWNVGAVLAGLGREPDARSHLAAARELLGKGSPREAALVDLELAGVEAQLGDVEGALTGARAALEQLEGLLGDESPELVPALGAVADLLVQHGDPREAERLYERAVRIGERPEASRPRLGEPLAGMSRLYLARGEISRAEGAAVASLSARAELYPRHHPELLGAHRALLEVALAKGDLKEATRQAELYQSIADGWLAADDPLRVDAMQVQALLAVAKGDRAGAVALARAALSTQRARPWQVLKLAEAQGLLGLILGARDAEGARLLREATRSLLAAKAFGSPYGRPGGP